ncbi:MAG TPA: GNAT family N-acetyltransferase [Gemmatimonadales bacterium]|nr:GNAT family N-acetyltransferase [Gemmatimonadales bacterium]
MTPSGYFLATARLGFRTWSGADRDFAVALWGDPAVTRFIDRRGALTAEQVAARLADEIAAETAHGVQYWPVFLLDDGGFVGCCGLRPYDPAERVLELGVHIRSACWGRGYAAEAATAVIAHAFGPLGAARLIAGHHPDNAASRRLLARLGFRYTHDEPYPPTGLRHPSYLLDRPGG